MTRNDPIYAKKLENIYRDAYKKGFLILDYSNFPNPELNAYIMRNALYNFRKKIRVNKLNPEYTELWKILERLVIVKISESILVIRSGGKIYKDILLPKNVSPEEVKPVHKKAHSGLCTT